ncbi:MAG: transglycosylase SLT domain-containing protein [Leptospirales bacterium]
MRKLLFGLKLPGFVPEGQGGPVAQQALFFCALLWLLLRPADLLAAPCSLPAVSEYITSHSRPPQSSGTADRMAASLIAASQRTALPLYLLVAIAQQESSFNPRAVNRDSGDYGLFQVHYAFWRAHLARRSSRGLREIRRADLLSIDLNVRAAALILSHDLRLSGGDAVSMLGRWSGRVGEAHKRYVEGVLEKGMGFLNGLRRRGISCR